ncbi:MAG TPA: 30S ribosomal protein S7 [Thermodesulfobacteriota bacterium]|jgi:small subunit ribosomal protein S7|nr:30S ribosomal protein S7 [Thermodesulfobacteriota bacterium]
MPRKREVKKREILPDPKYHDLLTAKFINGIMRRGKKSTGEGIFYGALDIIKDKTHSDPLKVFSQAMNNVKPLIEVRPRRVGGATYQVPVEVRPERKVALAIRWIIGFAKQRSEKTMEEKLSSELIDAANNRGAAIKKREDTHKMAEANKAFAHYRW